MEKRIFKKFRDLIYRESGIVLTDQKAALVRARIGKRMRSLGIEDYGRYLQAVERSPDGGELIALLDAISTNVTHFFREPRHFEVFEMLLKEWRRAGQRCIRIWCAASSTGEEPYSIAITAREVLGERARVEIIATDISTRALERARKAIYTERDVEQIPLTLLRRHFQKGVGHGAGYFRIKSALRRMVHYERLNLAHPPYALEGPFDVIFCRNVMIYFDNLVRAPLLQQMYELLNPGGCLMVGHSESLTGIETEFQTVEPSVYIKEPTGAVAVG